MTYYIMVSTFQGLVSGTLGFNACCDVPVGCHDISSVSPNSGIELGDDQVVIRADMAGCGFTNLADTVVTFGGSMATVLSVTSDTIMVRTPAGFGTVNVAVANSNGLVTVPGAFTYINSDVAARFGNVGSANGNREDVLTVNSSCGDVNRIITVNTGDPINLHLDVPSSRMTARYVLYAFNGRNDPTDVVHVRFDLGYMAFAPPFERPGRGSGNIVAIFNLLGHETLLRESTFNSQPAPDELFSLPNGLPNPICLTFQAIIRDDDARVPQGVSISNAVVLEVQ